MFDIGFWELSLIAVIALLILGPERLPRVARTAGLWVGKMKSMVAEVKSNIDEELRMEELNALKQTGEKIKEDLATTQNELKDAGTAFRSSVEEASITAGSVDESVDIVSAINESAPKSDEKSVRVDSASDTKKPAKSKAKNKTKRKVKKKTVADGKKSAKTKSTSKKPVVSSNVSTTAKKAEELAQEQKGQDYEAQAQATSNQGADKQSMPNQDPPDHSI